MSLKESCLLLLAVSIALFSVAGCTNDSGSTSPQALSSPARIASTGSGALVVSDYTANKFCLVDKSTLAVTACFQTKGKPTGVVYSDYDGGRYYVGNRSVRSVDMFDSQGAFLGHLGGSIGLFDRVNDLAIDPVGQQIYVLDSGRKEVKIFEYDGHYTGISFGPSTLFQPTALEFDTTARTILVSDFGDPSGGILPRVKIYDEHGLELDELVAYLTGGMLSKSQTFSAPQGLAVHNGYLFIVDASASEIQVYDLSTKLQVKTIGVRGTGDGELFYPLDVSVDASNGDVFVTDNRNSRVVVFRGAGVLP